MAWVKRPFPEPARGVDIIRTFWQNTDGVVRYGARYFEIDVQNKKECEAIKFWGKAKENTKLSWSLIAMQGGQVVNIHRY